MGLRLEQAHNSEEAPEEVSSSSPRHSARVEDAPKATTATASTKTADEHKKPAHATTTKTTCDMSSEESDDQFSSLGVRPLHRGPAAEDILAVVVEPSGDDRSSVPKACRVFFGLGRDDYLARKIYDMINEKAKGRYT